jgi:LysM repeat protein
MKTFRIILKIYLFCLQHSYKINEMAQAASDQSNLIWVRIVISYVQSRAWQRAAGAVDDFGTSLNTAALVIYNGEVPLLNSPPAPSDTFACDVHPGLKRQDDSSASCILPSGVTVEPLAASIIASLSSFSAAETASSAAIAASIASVESVSSVQASLSALSAAESASILSAESVSSVQASLNALSAVASRLSALSLSNASVESVYSALSPTITPTPPCTQDYVVVGGGTCYLIWTKFGITEADLYSRNILWPNCSLTIGQVLCVAWGPDPATISLPMAPSTTENNPTTPTDVQSIVRITPTGPVITGNPTNLPALPKLSTTDTMCPSPFGSTVIYEPKTGTGPYPTYPTPEPPHHPPPTTALPVPNQPCLIGPECQTTTTTRSLPYCTALGCFAPNFKCITCPGGLDALTYQAALCPPDYPSWVSSNG